MNNEPESKGRVVIVNTKTVDVKQALAAAKTISATVAALRTRRSELSQERTQLQQDNEALYRQPLQRSDVKALLMLCIDRWGDEFLQHWSPVIADFAVPRGPRPQTLEGQQQATDAADARVARARSAVEQLQNRLAVQERQVAEANAAAERGERYQRPRFEAISADDLTQAHRVLREAEQARRALERPGSIILNPGTFQPASAPMMVQDAAAVLAGGHTSMLASFDGVPLIDHYRNIFSGALHLNMSLTDRGNQDIGVKSACFFFGDLIKAKVEKHFDSVLHADEQAEAALLPLDECRARIAANEEQAAKIQGEIDQIDSQLSQLTAEVTD